MTSAPTPSLALRVKAAVCRACPLCIVARRWPRSAFARTLQRLEANCPFCRAYAELRRS